MKKYNITLLIALAVSLVITSCGLSEDNKKSLEEALSSLNTEKEYAESIYGQLTDDSYKDSLSELSDKYALYKDLESSKVKSKEFEDTLSGINNLTESYKSLSDQLNTELSNEQAAAAESEKHIEILSVIQNKSGSEIKSIVLKDNSQNTKSDNLLLSDQTLPSGTMLLGAVLPVYTDSTSFAILVTDTLGNVNEYDLPLTNLTNDEDIKISITINTPETGVSIGDYVSDSSSESDSVSDDASDSDSDDVSVDDLDADSDDSDSDDSVSDDSDEAAS